MFVYPDRGAGLEYSLELSSPQLPATNFEPKVKSTTKTMIFFKASNESEAYTSTLDLCFPSFFYTSMCLSFCLHNALESHLIVSPGLRFFFIAVAHLIYVPRYRD